MTKNNGIFPLFMFRYLDLALYNFLNKKPGKRQNSGKNHQNGNFSLPTKARRTNLDILSRFSGFEYLILHFSSIFLFYWLFQSNLSQNAQIEQSAVNGPIIEHEKFPFFINFSLFVRKMFAKSEITRFSLKLVILHIFVKIEYKIEVKVASLGWDKNWGSFNS